MTVLLFIAGLIVFSGFLVGSLLAFDKIRYRHVQRRVGSRRLMPQDAYPFGSLAEQAALYGRFWEIVGPLRAANAPVVPGDGGAPRWTP